MFTPSKITQVAKAIRVNEISLLNVDDKLSWVVAKIGLCREDNCAIHLHEGVQDICPKNIIRHRIISRHLISSEVIQIRIQAVPPNLFFAVFKKWLP